MRIAAIVILVIVLVLVGGRVWAFFVQEQQLSSNVADVEARLTKAKSDETDLQAEVQYLANPLNLEKELRARFNYKKPGETMVVIVPAETSTTTSTPATAGQ